MFFKSLLLNGPFEYQRDRKFAVDNDLDVRVTATEHHQKPTKTVESQTIYKLKSRDSLQRTGVRHTETTHRGMSQLIRRSLPAPIFRFSVRVVPTRTGLNSISRLEQSFHVSYWKPRPAVIVRSRWPDSQFSVIIPRYSCSKWMPNVIRGTKLSISAPNIYYMFQNTWNYYYTVH